MSMIKSLCGALAICISFGGVGAAQITKANLAASHEKELIVAKQANDLDFTPAQRKIGDEIISIFENDTPNLQYGYIENLHDGRGYTAGRGGFTTATGDMLQVLQLYAQQEPDNPFVKLIPIIQQRSTQGDDDVSDLADLEKLWVDSANDPVFCKCQDSVVDRLIYEPALDLSRKEGLRTPLGLLIIYDTVVEQGSSSDPDGTPALIAKTNKQAGVPGAGVAEAQWLQAFLDIRKQTLRNPVNTKTQEAWAESVTRCDALDDILQDRNMDLSGPINITVFGEHWTVTDTDAFRTDLNS